MSEEPDQLLKEIGQRIAELRQTVGLTQRELAERVNMAPANVNRIEQGMQNLTVRSMAKLAAALGVKTAELFEAPGETRRRRGRPAKSKRETP